MKTIKVKYLQFGNADAIINEDDFDPLQHARTESEMTGEQAETADHAPKKRGRPAKVEAE